jgi:hypothetical protein
MTETLKPCPFCGGVPDGNCFYADQGDKWGRVVCGCGAQGPEVRTSYDVSEDAPWHDDAIAEWNTRAAPREPSPEAINAASRVTGAWIGDADDPLALDEVKRIPAMLRAAYAVDFPAAPRPDAGDGTGEP